MLTVAFFAFMLFQFVGDPVARPCRPKPWRKTANTCATGGGLTSPSGQFATFVGNAAATSAQHPPELAGSRLIAEFSGHRRTRWSPPLPALLLGIPDGRGGAAAPQQRAIAANADDGVAAGHARGNHSPASC